MLVLLRLLQTQLSSTNLIRNLLILVRKIRLKALLKLDLHAALWRIGRAAVDVFLIAYRILAWNISLIFRGIVKITLTWIFNVADSLILY